MSKESKKGALPFALERGFTQVPNAVLRHYLYYPKFNGNTASVYAFLLSNYNEAFGYAYPTHVQVAQATNMTEKTVGGHIKLLSDVGLINVKENGGSDNHTYTFNSPIEVAEVFFEKYPEAGDRWRTFNESLTKSKADKDARKKKKKAKNEPVIKTDAEDDIKNWL